MPVSGDGVKTTSRYFITLKNQFVNLDMAMAVPE